MRLRRDKSWVLPKGKLYPGEHALAAAKREVLEETGHEVSVHEFLGSMSYPVDGKIKIVQFWHMRAVGGPVRELTHEIKAVKWLSLKQAIDTLTRAHEKMFLANVGPAVLKAAKQVRARTSPPSGLFATAASGTPERTCCARGPFDCRHDAEPNAIRQSAGGMDRAATAVLDAPDGLNARFLLVLS